MVENYLNILFGALWGEAMYCARTWWVRRTDAFSCWAMDHGQRLARNAHLGIHCYSHGGKRRKKQKGEGVNAWLEKSYQEKGTTQKKSVKTEGG